MWRDLKKIIHQNQSFLLTTHVNPDGDGIGAACALNELLLFLGKDVRFVCGSAIPAKLSFLDYHDIFEVYDPAHDYSGVEVLVVLDAHKKERIGDLAVLTERKGVISVCIDHHVMEEAFTSHTFIDPAASSVGTMIYTLYKEMGYDLNLEAATGIYSSIVCDTGRFSYSSTSRKAIKIADECIKVGVNPDVMHARLFQQLSWEQVKIFSQTLGFLETFCDNKIIVLKIALQDNGCDNIQDIEYIHEFTKLIEGVECTIILRELPKGLVRVSMRSKYDLGIDEMMKKLGGGGHKKAAGGIWKGSLKEAQDYLVPSLSSKIDFLIPMTSS
ncbi:MAG: DHH family phosphoesterase [Chlamydiota bacterium]